MEVERLKLRDKYGLTISTGGPCVYVKAPEFKEPVIINSPIYSPPVNPDYIKLAQIAYDTVLQTMLEGAKTHPDNDWQSVDIMEHFRHALDHLANWELEEKDEPHLDHAITRLVMIKYLEEYCHDQTTRQTNK